MVSVLDLLILDAVYLRFSQLEISKVKRVAKGLHTLICKLEIWLWQRIRDSLHPRLLEQVILEKRVLAYRSENNDDIAETWAVLSIRENRFHEAPLYVVAVEED
eukprot:5246395-Karenia_brevis.AAC.1